MKVPLSFFCKQEEAEYTIAGLIAFSRLDEKEQLAWMEKRYADGDITFFSIAVEALDGNDSLLDSFAEKAYTDGEIAFFSILTDYMDEAEVFELFGNMNDSDDF